MLLSKHPYNPTILKSCACLCACMCLHVYVHIGERVCVRVCERESKWVCVSSCEKKSFYAYIITKPNPFSFIWNIVLEHLLQLFHKFKGRRNKIRFEKQHSLNSIHFNRDYRRSESMFYVFVRVVFIRSKDPCFNTHTSPDIQKKKRGEREQ